MKSRHNPLADSGSEHHLRQWAKRVLIEKGWDQKQWAREAGVDASTVHRILSRSDYAPRYGTLERLCKAAGSWPNVKLEGRVSSYPVPVMSMDRLRECYAINRVVVPSMGEEGEVPVTASLAPAFACIIVTGSDCGGGFRAGDMVVCQPISERLPVINDLVLVDLAGSAGLSVVPFETVDPASLRLFGVVVQLIRSFPPADCI